MGNVLLVGESWMSYTTHVKGFDSFYTSVYETGEKYIKDAIINAGYEFTFMPNHLAMTEFPYKLEELKKFDLIILSDIGANTLLLPVETFYKSKIMPNRCNLIRDYVKAGGSLLMIGGYLSFSGVDAKGKWQDTAVQEVLPVNIMSTDDRMEHCEGVAPVTVKDHDILKGLDKEWPAVLGYNKTILKPESEMLASICGDPFIAIGKYGKGKSAVFTSDCAPHWCPPEFCEWKGYNILFKNLINWLTEE